MVGGALAVLAAVVAGTIAHELAHAAVLEAVGVPWRIAWLPDRGVDASIGTALTGGWARVRPGRLPADLAPWKLRLAAVAPFVLAIPFVLTLLGVLPDPIRTGDPVAIGAAIGWLGCALPSPQDFSLFWHADRAIAGGYRRGEGDLNSPLADRSVSGGTHPADERGRERL